MKQIEGKLHILLRTILLVLAISGCSLTAFGAVNTTGSLEASVTVSVKGKLDYQRSYEALEYTNKLRAALGEEPLVMDRELLEAAMQRAAESALAFSHTRPDGSSCFTVSGKIYGENLAIGQSTAAKVVSDWKSSTGHYQNMVNGDYRSIGIGCFQYNGVYYWAQSFGYGDAVTLAKPSNQTRTMQIQLAASYISERYLKVSGVSSSVQKGKQVSLSLVFSGAETTQPVVLSWANFNVSSSDPSVLSVTSAGVIKGLKKGSAKLLISHKQVSTWQGAVNLSVTDSNSRKVVFQANGGSLSKTAAVKKETRTVQYNRKYGTLPVPVRKGYAFKGWYTKKSGGTRVKATAIVKISRGKTQTLYARWRKVTVNRCTISSLYSRSTGKTDIRWKKISGAKGYQICLSLSPKFTAASTQLLQIEGNKKNACSIKNLQSGKKYYVRIRAYKKDSAGNRVYGKYSAVRSIKIKN